MAGKTSRDINERKNLANTMTLRDGIIKGHEKDIDSHTNQLLRVISPHITEMSSLMSTPGPEKRISFTKVHETTFIDNSSIHLSDIEKAITDCKIISKNFVTYSNPFYILISNLIGYHHRKHTVTGKVEVAKLLTLYLALRIYKAAFGAFYPNFVPNPEVMSATIEGLNSNRFNVKKYKTMFNTVVYISESHYENFADILDNPIDDNVIYYISNLYSRIKLMMRLITQMYYENHKKGIRQGTETLQSEGEDGETYLNEVENVSTLVAINSRKIYLSFVSDTVANPKILRNVCSITKVSFSKFTITIGKILDAREPMVETLLVKMLSYFYSSGGKSIKSPQFINMMVDVYKVSNSADQLILEIKETLDQIMKKYSAEYLKSSHAGMISAMKKTIHLYLTLYAVDVM